MLGAERRVETSSSDTLPDKLTHKSILNIHHHHFRNHRLCKYKEQVVSEEITERETFRKM